MNQSASLISAIVATKETASTGATTTHHSSVYRETETKEYDFLGDLFKNRWWGL